MSHLNLKNLSPLVQAAVDLDHEFADLARLSAQIEEMSFESEGALDRARNLLARFGETANRVGEGVQKLAHSLEDARAKAEKHAQVVGERAYRVQNRQDEGNRLFERFRTLVERAQHFNGLVEELKYAIESGPMASDNPLPDRLMKFDAELLELVNEMRDVKKEAHTRNFKTLEKNADSLAQSLNSAREKLSAFASWPGLVPASPALR